jgi:hypothetical protein
MSRNEFPVMEGFLGDMCEKGPSDWAWNSPGFKGDFDPLKEDEAIAKRNAIKYSGMKKASGPLGSKWADQKKIGDMILNAGKKIRKEIDEADILNKAFED